MCRFIKFLILVLVNIIIIFSNPKLINAQSNCTLIISRSTSLVNGRTAPYNTLKPGDTLCLEPGIRGPITFRNIKGSLDNPIKIVNSAGKVVIDSTNWAGFFFQNSQYFHLTGTGTTDNYGIQIKKVSNFGVLAVNKSEYFEIDHLEFDELLGSNIAIHSMTNSTCPGSVGNNDTDYDYNFDGVINSLDAVTRDNFTQHNVKLHDNLFQGFQRTDGTYSLDMAFYIGNSNFQNGYAKACKNPDGTTTTVTLFDPVIEGLYIYNNRMDTLGDKVLQVGSAVKDCEINNNTINKGAQFRDPTGQNDVVGINVNPGSFCRVFNNTVSNTFGGGINYRGNGGYIYNNLVYDVGYSGTYWREGIAVLGNTLSHGQNIYIINNTIINPTGNGIAVSSTEGTLNRIQNNIIVNPGAGFTYVSRPPGTNFVVDHNYQTRSISDIKFVDSINRNFRLGLGSPAINTGVDVSAYGIIDDWDGTSRPQGISYDIGAFEYVENNTTPTSSPSAKLGDANGDGKIDGADYIIWLNHYGQNVSGVNNGDFNSDGKVDGADYVIWLNNYY